MSGRKYVQGTPDPLISEGINLSATCHSGNFGFGNNCLFHLTNERIDSIENLKPIDNSVRYRPAFLNGFIWFDDITDICATLKAREHLFANNQVSAPITRFCYA